MDRQSASVPVPVLVTRPMAEARTFAEALAGRLGPRVHPVIAPLMAMEPLAHSLPSGPFAGVIFTSVAGVEAALPSLPNLPRLALCVGQKTAERAAAAGFLARSADGDASALVAAIAADPPGGRLLHLRGEDATGEVAERLNSAGIETESLVIYRQQALPLPPDAVTLLATEGPVILPLFSPRSAHLFRAVLPEPLGATLWLAAMSRTVAAAARPIPHQALVTARHPTAAAMLDACGEALLRAAQP